MAQQSNDAQWHDLLTSGTVPGVLGKRVKVMRRLYGKLPAEPRCKICNVPFSGTGGRFAHSILRSSPSTFSMSLCSRCEGFARAEKPGAEVDVALLFADVRGSTALAETMDPRQYSDLIDRFYTASADVLVDHEAIVEKLAGDQVAALFVPGLVSGNHALAAMEAASDLMTAYGYGDRAGPWIPVGAGVHRGSTFIGMVGTSGQMTELTSLGDPPNVTARLASAAASGETLVSVAAAEGSDIDGAGYEMRDLQLKGRSGVTTVYVIPPNLERADR